MMTSSNGNIFRVNGFCAGYSPVIGEFPAQSQWRGALIFFYLRLNRQLSKQWRRWWFETLLRSLWHQSWVYVNQSCPTQCYSYFAEYLAYVTINVMFQYSFFRLCHNNVPVIYANHYIVPQDKCVASKICYTRIYQDQPSSCFCNILTVTCICNCTVMVDQDIFCLFHSDITVIPCISHMNETVCLQNPRIHNYVYSWGFIEWWA